jgi:PDZ domain-containing secreted protein
VNANGNVGGIVGTTLKLQAAEDADTDVFFIPATNLDDLGDEGTTVLVVSVETLGDAVDWLCQAGATDDLCADGR